MCDRTRKYIMLNGQNHKRVIELKRVAKRAAKNVARFTLERARKIVTRSPWLKHAIKRGLLYAVPARVDLATYQAWVVKNFSDPLDVAKLKREGVSFKYRPKISVLVPVYNTNRRFLRDCLDSVMAQAYENWELCLVDDASTDDKVREIISEYAASDDRIKYKFLKKNQHIAKATNKALAMATGEFVALLDHDDILWPDALYEVAKVLNADKRLDFVYTDEDKITEDRDQHLGPFFKPDWNPDFLHSVNYITHLAVIRKSLLEDLGGLREEYNGAQDWDLFLRVTGSTKKIHHIPKILYSWRLHDLSTAQSTDSKPYVVAAQKKAIEDDLIRRGYKNFLVARDKSNPGYWNVKYKLRGKPKISIVIPSKNQYEIVKRCLDSIYSKTTYDNFEIILVDTGSTEKRVRRWYDAMLRKHTNFRLIDWPQRPFSYARSCNQGAAQASGELIVMLNNDTEVLTPDWLELMAGDAQRQEIGAVGCLLFYPDRYHIQHAGVGVGLGGVVANSFSMMTLTQPMSQIQHLMINTKHNITAVTAACMMLRKKVFDEIGGFDEKFRITYNDADLCLRLYEKGYQNLYTPYVRLLHHESISVGNPEELKKRDVAEFKAAKQLFRKRWSKYVKHDPNINPNLSKDNAFYDLKLD